MQDWAVSMFGKDVDGFALPSMFQSCNVRKNRNGYCTLPVSSGHAHGRGWQQDKQEREVEPTERHTLRLSVFSVLFSNKCELPDLVTVVA